MEQIRRLAVLGGDLRQISMTVALSRAGYEIRVWGLGECQSTVGGATLCDTWEEAIKGADAVILPLPITSDGVRLHCPLEEREDRLRISSLMERLGGRILLGGRISAPILALAEKMAVII